MFTSVPGRYDLVNRVVTLGLDQYWRTKAAVECLSGEPARILDLCTGTGDMAIKLAVAATSDVEIVGVDFVEPMLEAARSKAVQAEVGDRVSFQIADAADLPFQEGHFDAVTIAFGFRNLTYKNPNRDQHLKEILRVIAPGGKLVIVESSQPRLTAVRAGFGVFLAGFVAPVGGLLSGHGSAYRYLSSSIRNFYTAGQVSSLLEAAGFSSPSYTRLFAGVAALHVAMRAPDGE
jgi:demethylmenaquinone methyltransferase/2-methoxy-6-polyprenyl-1,4-benzoquinol methylase